MFRVIFFTTKFFSRSVSVLSVVVDVVGRWPLVVVVVVVYPYNGMCWWRIVSSLHSLARVSRKHKYIRRRKYTQTFLAIPDNDNENVVVVDGDSII